VDSWLAADKDFYGLDGFRYANRSECASCGVPFLSTIPWDRLISFCARSILPALNRCGICGKPKEERHQLGKEKPAHEFQRDKMYAKLSAADDERAQTNSIANLILRAPTPIQAVKEGRY